MRVELALLALGPPLGKLYDQIKLVYPDHDYPIVLEKDTPFKDQLKSRYQAIAEKAASNGRMAEINDQHVLSAVSSPEYTELLAHCSPYKHLPVLSDLGKGGYGKVYHSAFFDGNGIKPVAVKEISLEQASPSSILNEIINLKHLSYVENISKLLFVQMPDAFTVQVVIERLEGLDGGQFFAQCQPEYLPSLDSTFQLKIRTPLRLMAAIIHRLLCLLKRVHQAGIIHCDVKPGNLFFDRQGNIHLIDFGLAGPVDSPITGRTPGFAPRSPEAVRRPSYDIWTVGMTALYMVRPCLFEFNYDHHGVASSLTRYWNVELGKFIHDCLNFDPNRRPTIDELLQSPFIVNRASSAELVQFIKSTLNNPPLVIYRHDEDAMDLAFSVNPDYLTLKQAEFKTLTTHVIGEHCLPSWRYSLDQLVTAVLVWKEHLNFATGWIPLLGFQIAKNGILFQVPKLKAMDGNAFYDYLNTRPHLHSEIDPLPEDQRPPPEPTGFVEESHGDEEDSNYTDVFLDFIPSGPHPITLRLSVRMMAIYALLILRALRALYVHGLKLEKLSLSSVVICPEGVFLRGAETAVRLYNFEPNLRELADILIHLSFQPTTLADYPCSDLRQLILECQKAKTIDELIANSALLKSVDSPEAKEEFLKAIFN